MRFANVSYFREVSNSRSHDDPVDPPVTRVFSRRHFKCREEPGNEMPLKETAAPGK